MGVLPKGQRWPNSCTPAILAANARLQAYADVNPDWLTCLDVGDQFLTHQVLAASAEDKETPLFLVNFPFILRSGVVPGVRRTANAEIAPSASGSL